MPDPVPEISEGDLIMKIAVTSQGKDLDSALDPRFGRCQYFIIIDPDTEEFEAVPNESLMASGGAGIQSAQFLANRGIEAVITGNVGPNAARTLRSARIKVYTMNTGSVRDAIKSYKKGELATVSEATVNSHFGMSGRLKDKESEEGSSSVKIAVATDGPMVAAHFGRCPEYTIFTLNNGKVENKVIIPNPGHEPGFLPGYLGKLGVSCIIAGGMGPRAQGLFAENNIRTITGVSGRVDEAINSYLAGRLESGESLCEHGQEGHECNHKH